MALLDTMFVLLFVSVAGRRQALRNLGYSLRADREMNVLVIVFSRCCRRCAMINSYFN